jgi:hypothetical protein
MGSRFIQVLQKDIVTNPEEWKHAGPGKYILLSDKAKRVYAVLSVIAYSQAGKAKGTIVNGGIKLGVGWFWTSHALLQQLTGSCQKTVQRGIKELHEEGFIGYHPAKKNGHQCFFKIKRIKYNNQDVQESRAGTKTSRYKKPPKRNEVESEEPDVPGDDEFEKPDIPNLSIEENFEEPDVPGDDEFEKPDMPHLECEESNGDSGLPDNNASEISEVQKAETVPEKPVKLFIPYKEGVLFQSGENTHDEEGYLIDKNGDFIPDIDFTRAEQIMQSEGEEAALKIVSKANIENHLVPKYREQCDKLKN